MQSDDRYVIVEVESEEQVDRVAKAIIENLEDVVQATPAGNTGFGGFVRLVSYPERALSQAK